MTQTKQTRIATNRDAVGKLIHLEPFTNASSSFSARWIDLLPIDLGALPNYCVPVIDAMIDRAGKVYAVFSYQTIIAVYSHNTADSPIGGLYMPDEKYSVTTSKHQAITRRAFM